MYYTMGDPPTLAFALAGAAPRSLNFVRFFGANVASHSDITCDCPRLAKVLTTQGGGSFMVRQ